MDAALKDWRQLGAGRELDRLIAERLGYQVRPHQTRLAKGYALFAPDGEPVENDDGFVNVYRCEGNAYSEILEYSTSVDDALILIDDLNYELYRNGPPQSFVSIAQVGRWDAEDDYELGKADTPALAISRAWLAWQDALATRRDL